MTKQKKPHKKWNRAHEWRLHNHSGENKTRHPAFVYGKNKNRRRFLCFTHSETTKGSPNVKLKHNVEPTDPRDCYLVPRPMTDDISHLDTVPKDRFFRIHAEDKETVKKYKK